MSRGKWAVVIVALCLIVTAMAIAYAAGKAKAVPVAEVVRAKRFELVDAQGRVRLEIGMAGVDGWQTAGVRLSDGTGRARVGLAVFPDGTPSLNFTDKNGNVRAMLVVFSNGIPCLSLSDAEGKTRAMLYLDADGHASLSFSDVNGKVRAAMGKTALETIRTGATEQTAESSLVLFDKDGKVMWQAP